jgi:hypothetical protein
VVYNPLPDFPIAGYRWSVDADEIVSDLMFAESLTDSEWTLESWAP